MTQRDTRKTERGGYILSLLIGKARKQNKHEYAKLAPLRGKREEGQVVEREATNAVPGNFFD